MFQPVGNMSSRQHREPKQQAAGCRLHSVAIPVQHMSMLGAGQTSLIPLTSSLYVEAELDSSASVLVELGTGYYAEVH